LGAQGPESGGIWRFRSGYQDSSLDSDSSQWSRAPNDENPAGEGSSGSANQGIASAQPINKDEMSTLEDNEAAHLEPAANFEAPVPSIAPAAIEPPWLHSADSYQLEPGARRIDVASPPASEAPNDATPLDFQPPPAAHHKPEPSSRGKPVLVGLGVLLLLGAGSVIGVGISKDGSAQTSLPSVAETAGETTDPASVPSLGPPSDSSSLTASPWLPSTSPPISPPPSPSPRFEADAQRKAKRELARLAADGRHNVTLDSRWVAQLSSKWIGITDPLQITASGSHTFQATDILAEHLQLKNTDNRGAQVFMLRNLDFGAGKRPDGRLLWMTFADGGFSSREDAHRWCNNRFPNLHGKRLKNTCLPNRLRPLRD
jgi:hypothetical protein